MSDNKLSTLTKFVATKDKLWVRFCWFVWISTRRAFFFLVASIFSQIKIILIFLANMVGIISDRWRSRAHN